jgi:NAD(P)-dependent dehydrogenase (short-subunit alcohol dehydrogenase family)
VKIQLPEELIFLQNRKLPQKITTTSMKGQVVIITGATSGVGFQAVQQLAKAQAHIVMINRNAEKSARLQNQLQAEFGVKVDVVLADLSHLSDVRKATEYILDFYPRIDVLINCAGMHSTRATYTKEGFETVFCVNHLSSFLLTMLLLDRLIESAPSRILQVNSEGHRFNGLDLDDLHWQKRRYTGLKGYGASKTAQLLTLWEIDDELKETGVTINAMHPGDVKTNIGKNNGWLYRLFRRLFVDPMLGDPKVSGESIYFLVADPAMSDVSGKFFHLTIEEKPAKHALDRDKGNVIYSLSKDLTGINGVRS